MTAAAPITPPTPGVDTRLMNATASLLLWLVGVACVLGLGWWAMQLPLFTLQGIHISGDTAHSNAYAVRREVLPQLQGNFFTLRLGDARSAFQGLPWVRNAVVRRVFPNRLAVQLEEHHEAAWWGNDAEGYRMLNQQGEIFDANPEEAVDQHMPELSGPDEAAPQVLQMYRTLNPLFAPLQASISSLALEPRGGWSLVLDNEAVIQLGSGNADELGARIRQFVQTIVPVVGRYGRGLADLRSADLRYRSGYALQLKGVGTVDADAAATQQQGAQPGVQQGAPQRKKG